MALEISSALLARLVSEAGASPDTEVCGLLFGGPDCVTAAQACRNVAEHPRSAFEIDPAALIAAHRRARGGGAAIVGCYHSHPGGRAEPSARDAAAAAPDGSLWLIIAGSDVGYYRAVDNGSCHGRFDLVERLLAQESDLASPRACV